MTYQIPLTAAISSFGCRSFFRVPLLLIQCINTDFSALKIRACPQHPVDFILKMTKAEGSFRSPLLWLHSLPFASLPSGVGTGSRSGASCCTAPNDGSSGTSGAACHTCLATSGAGSGSGSGAGSPRRSSRSRSCCSYSYWLFSALRRRAAHPGVRHIENAVQTRKSAGFIQQGDALGTPAHIAVHTVAPDVKVGTGGSIRALGKGKIFFSFAWYSIPPFSDFRV